MQDRSVCIIGGLPRSGTRQFTDILNACPGVEIKSEIWPTTLREVGRLMTIADHDQAGRENEQKFKARRTEAALTVVSAVGKDNAIPGYAKSARIIGFKLPRVELEKETLDILLADHEGSVVLFFCVRSVTGSYLSHYNRWQPSVSKWSKKAIESFEAYTNLAADPRYTIVPLHLNAFVSAPHPGAWLSERIFAPLGRNNIGPDAAQALLAQTTNRNSGKRRTGKDPLPELSGEMLKEFQEQYDLHAALDGFAAATGLELWDIA